jgi:hypothetical protein
MYNLFMYMFSENTILYKVVTVPQIFVLNILNRKKNLASFFFWCSLFYNALSVSRLLSIDDRVTSE